MSSDKVLIAISRETAQWYAYRESTAVGRSAGLEMEQACTQALEAPLPDAAPTFETLYVYENRMGVECNGEGPPQVPRVGDRVDLSLAIGHPNVEFYFVVEQVSWETITPENGPTRHRARVYLAWSNRS